MPVKIDPAIVEELAALELVLWEAKHPKLQIWNEAKGKLTPREQKDWVIVHLAGPGVGEAPGSGKTLREAVDAALRHSDLRDRVPGLKGAMLRLEEALFTTGLKLAEQRYDRGGWNDGIDDDIPF